jgi:predicted O-linked N-acetylglucosamine transferase (SPINDLY family)
MTILKGVPGSVVWMFKGTDETNARLKQMAVDQGVAAERLVFADKMRNPDHLARFVLADLFLDTLPYGAHTSASDAMWMGVPVLTMPGRGFASRVCGSLVRAAGTPELICDSAEDYVRKAIELGNDRKKLAEIKGRLAAGRDSCTLFDTPALIADLEDLYRQMWDEFMAGNLPQPDLRNIETYHEIGCGEDLANIETLSDEAYRALYHRRLSERDRAYPIPPDSRLWPAGSAG